ncbi:MAG: TraB/GumN family protein [Erythrobacter sp.]
MISRSTLPQHSKAQAFFRLAIAALLMVLAFALGSCSGGTTADQAKRGAPPNPLFYEIARDDGLARGWMLGTIHALPDDTEWRTPAITAAVDTADRLIVEVAELGDGATSAQVFQELALTPGLPPLAERLAPQYREHVSQLAAKAGLTLTQQQRTESWAAALMLARVNAAGDPANGVDRALIGDFAQRPIRELEGTRGQLGLFDRLPEADQRRLLLAVVTASAQGPTEAEALRAAWLSGDLLALERASTQGIMADPRLRAALLVDRNHRWVPLIERELQASGRPLIAVGAAHLVGPEGLVALLEQRGWRLRRLI